MKYSNELKVGTAIIVSAIIFFLGVRYFEDIPLFRGTYELYTSFDNADGLMVGNPVRVNGVNVGAVEEVRLAAETQDVRVRFHLDENVRVPEGSVTSLGGISALGGIHMVVRLGPPSNPLVPEDGFVPSRVKNDLMALADRAPGLVNKVDSILTSVDLTVGSAQDLLRNSDGDLRTTLIALRSTAGALEQAVRTEQVRLGLVLDNFGEVSEDLRDFTGENSDSLALAVENLNRVLRRLNQNLDALERTTTGVDTLLARVNRPYGTFGMLVNDPGLYGRLDSAAINLNALLEDFRKRPGRYLSELELIDIF